MKISYILQLQDFFIMFVAGAIIGILYNFINLITLVKKHFIIQTTIDLLFSIIFVTILILMINFINLGEFRAFLTLGYLLGFILERIILGKLFAKGFQIMYTSITKLLKKLSNTKLGKVIFK